MKKIIYILIFVSQLVNGATYYVATDGNNSRTKAQAQNISTPWLTLQYAESQVIAGDTIFIRGGVYYITTRVEVNGISGTAENPIVVINYNDEVPILNADNLTSSVALYIYDVDYWIFKGLTVCNAKQDGDTDDFAGWHILRSDNLKIENCVSHDNEGPGFYIRECDNMQVINCDAYNNFNPVALSPSKPGGAGQGFGFGGSLTETDTTKWVHGYFYGCRSWNNSDNGFGGSYAMTITYDNCWAYNNGWQLFDPLNPSANGDGRGFTMGLGCPSAPPSGQIIIKNCISARNKGYGFHLNCNSYTHTADVQWYNNIAMYNREYGFVANFKTNIYPNVYRNNIAYPHGTKIAWNNGDAEFSMEPLFIYTSDHNSWDADPAVTVNAEDFISLDTTELRSDRQADGSLPIISFGKLAAGSDLINAGVDVGLDYVGAAPDLGYDEYYFGGQDYDEWYIDPTGDDDTGEGSEGNPWATLSYACSQVTEAGDIIHVAAGTYTESARSVLATGVNIIGTGATSIIKSSYADGYLILAQSTSLNDTGNVISGLAFDGEDTGYGAILIRKRNNSQVSNCTFTDFTNGGVMFDNENTWEVAPETYMTGIVFADNTVTNCTGLDTYSNLTLNGLSGAKIYGNTISSAGIKGTNEASKTDGFVVIEANFLKALEFYNNTVISPDTVPEVDYDYIIGAEMWNNLGGCLYYNNTFQGGGGLDIGGHNTLKGSYDYAVRIYNNTFSNDTLAVYRGAPPTGITLENWIELTDCYVYNNKIYNYYWGISATMGVDTGRVNNINIYYNLIDGVGTSGAGWGAGILCQVQDETTIKGYYNTNIFNNTIYGRSATASSGIYIVNSTLTQDLRIQNNIIQGFNAYAIRIDTASEGGANVVDSIYVTNNIMYGNDNNGLSTKSGITTTNSTVEDNLTSDPLFRNASAHDFRLTASSPAVNAGKSVGLSSDIQGLWVNDGLPDIGAYEYRILKLKSEGKFLKSGGKFLITR